MWWDPGGRYATHDLFIIVSGVFTEPDLTVLTFADLPTNPVLVYHPYLALANGVHLVGYSNGTWVASRIFWATHGCCLEGIGSGNETACLCTRWIDGAKPVRGAAVEWTTRG